MRKIVVVWLMTIIVGTGIAVCVNVWVVQDPVAPALIGTYFGIQLGFWTYSQKGIV